MQSPKSSFKLEMGCANPSSKWLEEILMAGMQKKVVGGALIMLLIMAGSWLTAQFLSGLALTVGNFLVGTGLIIVGLMFVSMYATSSALDADTLKNMGGGFKRGTGGAWVIILVACAILVTLGIIAYALLTPAPQALVGGAGAPVIPPGQLGSTETLVVHGLVAASTVTPISCEAGSIPTAQTPQWTAIDFDQGTAVAPTANVTLKNYATGVIYQATTTTPGMVYYNLVSTTNYANDLVTMRTGCSETGPVGAGTQKAIDTSVSFAVYNQGGHTLNTAAANQSMTGASTKTFDVEITPSAKNKHIAGFDNHFAVIFNVTSTANWSASNFAVKLVSGFATSGAQCVQMALPTNPAAATGFLAAFDCEGDFSAADTGTYKIDASVYPVSTYAAGDDSIEIGIAPIEYYQQVNAQVGKPKGSIQVGVVKDDGSAIQAIQWKSVYVI